MIAIIPARGGSKGLPGKNIRPLLGKPLIAYAIESALGARSIDRVVVSTDDPEIAAVARRFGGEVPFMRPEELATDTAAAVDNYIYTVDRLAREGGSAIDSFAVLLPTAPLRTSEDVDKAVAQKNGNIQQNIKDIRSRSKPETVKKVNRHKGKRV